MKKQLLILPSIFFLLILLIFFYLLIIDRNPSELPSTLLDKNVPKFETESLLKDENFISPKEFKNEILLEHQSISKLQVDYNIFSLPNHHLGFLLLKQYTNL